MLLHLRKHDKITSRLEHIDLQYHVLLQDWIQAGDLRLLHGRTRVVCADAMTENLILILFMNIARRCVASGS